MNVPTREEVSAGNQVIFDTLQKNIGKVPNLFATMAYSDYGLQNYVTLSNARSSLKAKEKEVVNLVVSEVNACLYCSSAHTALAKMNGFTDEQILEIRKGTSSFDPKLDALARYVKSAAENKGHADPALLEQFFAAGWTKGNLVDVIVVIGDKIITNYLYAATGIPVDFPLAPSLQ